MINHSAYRYAGCHYLYAKISVIGNISKEAKNVYYGLVTLLCCTATIIRLAAMKFLLRERRYFKSLIPVQFVLMGYNHRIIDKSLQIN